jgi:hypothetical protein
MNEWYYSTIGMLLAQKWNAKKHNKIYLEEWYSKRLKEFIKENYIGFEFNSYNIIMNKAIQEATPLNIIPYTNKYFLKIIYPK